MCGDHNGCRLLTSWSFLMNASDRCAQWCCRIDQIIDITRPVVADRMHWRNRPRQLAGGSKQIRLAAKHGLVTVYDQPTWRWVTVEDANSIHMTDKSALNRCSRRRAETFQWLWMQRNDVVMCWQIPNLRAKLTWLPSTNVVSLPSLPINESPVIFQISLTIMISTVPRFSLANDGREINMTIVVVTRSIVCLITSWRFCWHFQFSCAGVVRSSSNVWWNIMIPKNISWNTWCSMMDSVLVKYKCWSS